MDDKSRESNELRLASALAYRNGLVLRKCHTLPATESDYHLVMETGRTGKVHDSDPAIATNREQARAEKTEHGSPIGVPPGITPPGVAKSDSALSRKLQKILERAEDLRTGRTAFEQIRAEILAAKAEKVRRHRSCNSRKGAKVPEPVQ